MVDAPGRMKISDGIVRLLAQEGVTHVFELSGGMIAHLLDSLARQTGDRKIRVVSMHHEQGAGFAAQGHAMMSGIPGVALATSGPGATNLLTAIGSCYFDSTPAVFITGQVNRNEMKGSRPVRQQGFQETDIVSIARPVTKGAFQVLDPAAVPGVIREAFSLARSGRPGPVLVDLPLDVQRTELPRAAFEPVAAASAAPAPVNLAALWPALRAAKRPVVIAGGGVQASRAAGAIRAALERLNLPVALSLLGVDVLGHDHPLRVGMLGSYGNRWTNHAVGESDFLLVLGSRLDIRQTGADAAGFARGRTIVQVDCDPGEINNRVTGVTPIVADLKDFAAAVLAAPPPGLAWPEWTAHIEAMRAQWPDTWELRDAKGINPNALLRQAGEAFPDAAAFVADVGQHQMWAAQSVRFRTGQRFLTSGGMGSMGFGLPAAIGAAIASPGRPVLLVAGDGGFQSNIQELQTVVRNRLPVRMIVLNNHSHGMVRQFQESYFESRFQSTVQGYDAPSFARVAEAYGIRARTIASPGEIAAALDWLRQDPAGPALLEVEIAITTNAYPKLAFGLPITEMEPLAKPVDLNEGT